MKTKFFRSALIVFTLFGLIASGSAASDTDVTILKATKVVIEKDQIIITASAMTSMVVVSGDLGSGKDGKRQWGRPAEQVSIKSDQATFTIRPPKSTWRVPEGMAPEQRAKAREVWERGNKTMLEGWEMSVNAAKALQAGEEVGRIGYYQPTVTLKDSMIHAVEGFGFLYEKGK